METISSLCNEHPEFRERWVSIFKPMDMQCMMDVRIRCDSLFEEELWKCFEEQVVRRGAARENMMEYCKQLFRRIIKEIQDIAEMCEPNIPEKMSIDVLILSLQKEYEDDPTEFILQLVKCFEKERELINSYRKTEEDSLPDSSITLMDKLREVEIQGKNVDDETKRLSELIRIEDEQRQGLTEMESYMREINKTNGIVRQKNKLEDLHQQINDSKLNIVNALDCLTSQTCEVLGVLKEKVKSYQKKQQLHYVDLEQKPTMPMEAETGFSLLGKLFYDLLSGTIPKLHAICENFIPDERLARIQELFRDLLQSSFIVTDQVRHVIKVELGSKKRCKDGAEESCGQKFKCPTFRANVRMLGGKFVECKSSVRAQFCQEKEVNEKFRERRWNKPCEFKLKPKVDEAPFDKKKDIASFTRMELERFERKPDKQVCEDKFRIVFLTNMKVMGRQYEFVTISLPIVVTTGASQGCNVHGSLLWQCFSTEDVFSMPIEPIVNLPWGRLFDMLNAKFQMLDGRALREDEKYHLGCRLTGEPVVTDDTEIPFKKFCVDKMMDIKENDEKKKSATFWMWFLAVFNLTKIHLKEYWRLNLIFGFISKKSAEEKLRNLRDVKPHTYMLRFSDKIITDGQGQNLCGAISAAFVYRPPKGIRHTDPFKAETLKKKTLAQCVKNTMGKESDKSEPLLQWLYPGGRSTNDAFESFHAETLSKGNTGYEQFEVLLMISFNDMTVNDENGHRRKKIATKRMANSSSSHTRQNKSQKSIQAEPEIKIELPDIVPPEASYSPYDQQQPSIPSMVHDFDSDSQTSFPDSVSSSCLNEIPSVASNASSESACSIQYPLNQTLQFQQQSIDDKHQQYPTLTKLLQGQNTMQDMSCAGGLNMMALGAIPVSQPFVQQPKMDFGYPEGNSVVCSTSNRIPGRTLLTPMETPISTQQDMTSDLHAQMTQFRQLNSKMNSFTGEFDLASHGINMANGLPLKREDTFLETNMIITSNENVPNTPEILDISHNLQNSCPQNGIFNQSERILETQCGTDMEETCSPESNQFLSELMSRRDSDPLKVQLIRSMTQILSSMQNTCMNQSGETNPSQIFQQNFPNM